MDHKTDLTPGFVHSYTVCICNYQCLLFEVNGEMNFVNDTGGFIKLENNQPHMPYI